MLSHFVRQIKTFLGAHEERLYLVLLLSVVAVLAFCLGRFSVLYSREGDFAVTYSTVASSSAAYVASKTGASYYPISCERAKDITEENAIYFKEKTDAEARGYTPAANCKGI